MGVEKSNVAGHPSRAATIHPACLESGSWATLSQMVFPVPGMLIPETETVEQVEAREVGNTGSHFKDG